MIRLNGQSSIPGFLALALVTFSLLCCTVKEDRDSCPCQLRFDLSEAFEGSDGTLTMIIQGESGFVKCDTLRRSDSLDHYSVPVPREKLTVDFYSPFGALKNPLEGYKPKEICDPVLNYSEILETDGEYLERKVMLHKNYCQLTVIMKGDNGVKLPYTLLFSSGIDGYLPGGTLSEGLFVERVSLSTDAICKVNILRQKDASLMLGIAPEGNDGITLRSFALGEYLQAAGYDWTAEDLEDLEITLDFAATKIVLATDKWTRTLEFNVVI